MLAFECVRAAHVPPLYAVAFVVNTKCITYVSLMCLLVVMVGQRVVRGRCRHARVFSNTSRFVRAVAAIICPRMPAVFVTKSKWRQRRRRGLQTHLDGDVVRGALPRVRAVSWYPHRQQEQHHQRRRRRAEKGLGVGHHNIVIKLRNMGYT